MKAVICFLAIVAVGELGVVDAIYFNIIRQYCCRYPVFYRNGMRAVCKTGTPCGCSVITYKCRSGYKVTGMTFNTCRNRNWVSPHPTCEEENKCLTTRRPCDRNAKCTPKFNGFTCECNEGYHASGKRCNKGCPPPRVPTNGLVSPPPRDGKTYKEFARITFSCEPGYIGVYGRESSTCLYGRFYSNPPTCIRKDCEPPQAIENGAMSPSIRLAWADGHTVTYSCNSGFVLVGEKVSECQSDGTYSNPPPTCVAVCEEPVAPGNGTLVDAGKSWMEGDVASMTCNMGFTMMGDSTATCTGGNWVPPFNVTCTPEVARTIMEIGSGQQPSP